jgi:hydroxypyruvate isomerase
MEGQLIDGLTRNRPAIGHVQIADVPGRHEPGTGEINYVNVLAALDRAGYDGYVGLEYRPAAGTEDSLEWLPREARGRG